MKKLLFFIALSISLPIYAQMVDVLGSLGVQGAMTVGDTQSAAMGMSALKKNKILQDITQTAMQIKTQFMGDYSSVSRDSVFGNPFSGIDWDIGSETSNLFYIQLNQINKAICSSLLSARVPTVRTELNGDAGSRACEESNEIKFVFD